MAKKVLVLGAGMVAPPLTRYLLEKTDFSITVADLRIDKARQLCPDPFRSRAIKLDVSDLIQVEHEISAADAVISIVPNEFNLGLAAMCIKHKKHLLTASYVTAAMSELDKTAAEAGVLILNELGIDPGVDHMEAKRIIDEVKTNGGEIQGFTSFCGGLPAPESAMNPLGYKFSWYPKGVLRAGKNSAAYREKGKDVFVPGKDLFRNPLAISIEGFGELEGYPNRNSLPYLDLYEIPSVRQIMRGTLRFKGWCGFMQAAVDLGLLNEKKENLEGKSYADLLWEKISCPPEQVLKEGLSRFLKIGEDSEVIRCFDWLGLLSDDLLPLKFASALDILCVTMEKKLRLEPDERDLIILQHKFSVNYPGESGENIISTLIEFGIPNGATAMSQTVGLPLAIAARLVLEGRIGRTGAKIPVYPEMYLPILKELANNGISFKTEKIRLGDKAKA